MSQSPCIWGQFYPGEPCTEPSQVRGLCRPHYRKAYDRKVLDQIAFAPISRQATPPKLPKVGPSVAAPVAPPLEAQVVPPNLAQLAADLRSRLAAIETIAKIGHSPAVVLSWPAGAEPDAQSRARLTRAAVAAVAAESARIQNEMIETVSPEVRAAAGPTFLEVSPTAGRPTTRTRGRAQKARLHPSVAGTSNSGDNPPV